MKENIIIRQTTKTDHPAVYNLIKTAFETAAHRDGTEQDFAVGLRNSGNYIPELDLVAELGGQPIGHIMLTKTCVTQPDGGRHNTLLVALLSVLLQYRNAGAGTALMEEGLRIALAMGYRSAFLVGDPAYYRRFGYRPAHLYGIRHETLPPEYVMAKELLPGALDGVSGLVSM